MKYQSFRTMLIALAVLFVSASAYALSLSYEYGGVTYGTMDISAENASTLEIKYTANSPLPGTAQVTGFGFSFIPNTKVPDSVSDPLDGAFADDQDNLDWVELTNLNAIPNAANSSLTKFDFFYGVTEGDSGNLTPPGILAGQYDLFYLAFSGVSDLTAVDLGGFVQYTGIRIQSLPNDVNGGSLFLTDSTSVPEPATMLLLGTGLLGLAGFGRNKFKRN